MKSNARNDRLSGRGGGSDLERTSAYDYVLPQQLIATEPVAERADSRLLVLGEEGAPRHRTFAELPDELRKGDVLIRNTARVLPARLEGRKPTGGRVEMLALEPLGGGWDDPGPGRFLAMARASKPLRPGGLVLLGRDTALRVDQKRPDGRVELSFEAPQSLRDLLDRHGTMPLPPYIRRRRKRREEPAIQAFDRQRYQTVYADRPGAVAAPTAGLHFTPALLERLSAMGVELVDLHLDVGPGTFRPVETERLADHVLHRERYRISERAAEQLNQARSAGRRLVAVGTTVARMLEDQARRGARVRPGDYETDLFIRPGVPLRWLTALITNFHLPRSTLLALVCAVGGHGRVMAAYREAIRRDYRFYSYGDAMLVLAGGAASDR